MSVLLLHGLGGDRRQALSLLPEAYAATRIAPDLPGHGSTDLIPGEPITFAAFAARAASQLDGPVAVAGVSMGAGVALALAAARPDLVTKLILVRPSWLLDTPPPHLEPFLTIARILTTRGVDADAFRATAVYQRIAEQAPAMAQSLLGQFTRPCAVERARVLAEMPFSLPLAGVEAYRKLGGDVTIVAAPQDPVHPEWLAREMRALIPGARLVMVPRKLPDPAEHQAAVREAVVDALEH
ncbi:alpha/beta hydrolase [Actinoplanes sp. TBRC 11911]|uniref:alpha/beta fold hydrolase n=1 Tax=Actinoplanes sp. TBRC 11911 TaxID=2729386 RepID=UPI00145EB457|nr:alpha/beta hydrolase [Actinoplanes sp. TBRC 11911]NMO51392.1 alpha/beta hydrolase [Actinoplanes sp. TBRC 11911]